jgi:hypothetical protein
MSAARHLASLAMAASLTTCPSIAAAQTFDQWFDTRVDHAVSVATVAENSTGAERQREAPSDPRSTSLVDQTSSTDFVAAAVNLATVIDPRVAALTGSSATGAGTGSQVVTTSVYALLAGLNATRPTDPQFYAKHVNARRFSLTVGTAASDKTKHNTDAPATVFGVKVLLLNGRELFTKNNLQQLKMVQTQLSRATAAGAMLKRRIQEILFLDRFPDAAPKGVMDERFVPFLTSISEPQFAATIAAVPREVLDRIDAEILASADSFVTLQKQIRSAYDEIKGGQQLAVAYTSNTRPGTGYDEHRAELIFDYGISARIMWTANGSFDYLDKNAAGSTSEGRFATEFVGDLTHPADPAGRLPIRASVSGQFFWSKGNQIQRDLQAKLTVPLTTGVDLPFVYRYTNSTERDVSGAEAKVGLTVDLGRLLNAR